MSFDLGSFLTTLNSNVSGGVAAMSGAQLGAVITAATGSLTGPTQAAVSLGRDLDLYAKFVVPGWAGDTKSADMAMNLQITAAEITGLPTNVPIMLPMVWAAKDGFTLATAIAQVKVAAGLTS